MGLDESQLLVSNPDNISRILRSQAKYCSAEAYSSRGGQSRNPYNLAENPGGSSSGPAASVASNMCAFSLGTETDSSVSSGTIISK